ncbi:MAG: hypothetical protein Q9190_005563 [Brigantiaea leucoxantha]
MTNTAIDARSKFLNATANLYAVRAPGTSAHLMQEYFSVAESHNRPLKPNHIENVCKTCGTISIPGRNSRFSIVATQSTFRKRQGKASGENAKTATPRQKLMQTECLACHRVTSVPLQPSKRNALDESESRMATNTKNAGFETSKAPTVTRSEKTVSTNLASKRRAKTRKQGGLRAMLEKSRDSEQKQSGLGMDLFDLMREA